MPANTVVQVVQPGYSIGERVLRPAMVGVAKGGPKHAATLPLNLARSTARPRTTPELSAFAPFVYA